MAAPFPVPTSRGRGTGGAAASSRSRSRGGSQGGTPADSPPGSAHAPPPEAAPAVPSSEVLLQLCQMFPGRREEVLNALKQTNFDPDAASELLLAGTVPVPAGSTPQSETPTRGGRVGERIDSHRQAAQNIAAPPPPQMASPPGPHNPQQARQWYKRRQQLKQKYPHHSDKQLQQAAEQAENDDELDALLASMLPEGPLEQQRAEESVNEEKLREVFRALPPEQIRGALTRNQGNLVRAAATLQQQMIFRPQKLKERLQGLFPDLEVAVLETAIEVSPEDLMGVVAFCLEVEGQRVKEREEEEQRGKQQVLEELFNDLCSTQIYLENRIRDANFTEKSSLTREVELRAQARARERGEATLGMYGQDYDSSTGAKHAIQGVGTVQGLPGFGGGGGAGAAAP
eukprot:Hpha_TRINITY_DN7805_c0_g1::TRINITY_DN7805_c0_g1_i1::g.185519::m.185519